MGSANLYNDPNLWPDHKGMSGWERGGVEVLKRGLNLQVCKHHVLSKQVHILQVCEDDFEKEKEGGFYDQFQLH